MDRINPRPTFCKAMAMLENARCPECGRAFDPAQDSETFTKRMKPLNCSWCSERVMLIHSFRGWQIQDNAARQRRS